MYDLIIVGMGPAGIAAAIYAKRSNLNVLALEGKSFGGTLNNIYEIENYPGFDMISGPDFAFKLLEQINNLDITKKQEMVIKVEKEENNFIVVTNKDKYLAKKVIIATGRKPRKLSVINEDKYVGKGISYCAVCDGPFYKGKDVCVVGGGESALQETLYLSKIVNKIYLVHRKNKFRASEALVSKIKECENVEVIYDDLIQEIMGEEFLESVRLKSGRVLFISGLFVYIGFVPENSFLESLNILDSEGYIEVDKGQETKIKGLFAVGDTVKKDYYQIAIATNEGAIAALNAAKEINDEY